MSKIKMGAVVLAASALGCAADAGAPTNAREERTEQEQSSAPELGKTEQALTVSNCDTNQRWYLLNALLNALTVSQEGLDIAQSDSYAPRLLNWFANASCFNETPECGIASGSIIVVLLHVVDRLNRGDFAFDCDASHPSCSDTASFVQFSNTLLQPATIHLCSAYWDLPNAGFDSKTGRLLHELTHLGVVSTADAGGTGDFAYGVVDARNLALHDFKLAARNADNFQYYYEDRPPPF